MRRRYLYVLFAAAPALLISIAAAVFIGGVAAGFLWLFVFGDSTWPTATENVLGFLLIAAIAVLWFTCLGLAYLFGKSREPK